MSLVEPEDLLKFGMIPEFIGRFSVISTLNPLDEDDLMSILTKPKNALVKQYMKYFDMEGIKLNFSEGSLKAIAQQAIKKKTGARALRSILEDIMLEVMYELPSQNGVTECTVTKESILKKEKPRLNKKTTKEKKVA